MTVSFFPSRLQKVKNFNCCNIGKSGSSTFGLKLLKAFLDYFAKIAAKSSLTMENIIDWEHRQLNPTSGESETFSSFDILGTGYLSAEH